MSIRFAAAKTGKAAVVARVLRTVSPAHPANDTEIDTGHDLLLRSALRHFSQHGLGAVETARIAALAAHAEGTSEEVGHWLAVCGTFDQRAARALADKIGAKI